MNTLVAFFDPLANYKDERVAGRCKYLMRDILVIAALATICGCRGWKAIHNFAVSRKKNLLEMLPTLGSIPSKDTIARVVAAAPTQPVCESFANVSPDLIKRARRRPRGRPSKKELPDIISIDGKSVAKAIPRGDTRTKAHIVNAVTNHITLATHRVEDKSNEITANPIVVDMLDSIGMVKGKILTLDAMGCQKELAAKIIGLSGDYVFSVKDNHPILADQVSTFFTKAVVEDPGRYKVQRYTAPPQKQGAVIEQRWAAVSRLDEPARKWVTKASEWPGAVTVIEVRRLTEPTRKNRKSTDETRYFISSVDRPPEQLLEAIIKHWGVETVHNMLDVGYKEDQCRIAKGNAAEFLSTTRKLGLNFMVPIKKLHPDESVESLLELLRTDWTFMMDVIGKPPEEVMSPMEARERHGSGIVPSSAPVIGVKGGARMIPKQKAGQVVLANLMPKAKKTILMPVVAASASLSRKS
jgi:predicted transposase YbfD/YdcC